MLENPTLPRLNPTNGFEQADLFSHLFPRCAKRIEISYLTPFLHGLFYVDCGAKLSDIENYCVETGFEKEGSMQVKPRFLFRKEASDEYLISRGRDLGEALSLTSIQGEPQGTQFMHSCPPL